MAKEKNKEVQDNASTFDRGTVSAEVSGQDYVEFNVTPDNYRFEVVAKEARLDILEDEEEGTKTPTLAIIWTDQDEVQSHLERMYPVTEGNKHFTKGELIEQQDWRLAHIWNTYMGTGSHAKAGLGEGATSWEEFFEKVAEQINTGRDGGSIFKDKDGKPLLSRIFLVRDKRGRVKTPLGKRNFIELVREGRPSILRKKAKDNFEIPKTNKVERTGGVDTPDIDGDDLPPGFTA